MLVRSVAVFYFSGTGNTKRVVGLLERELEKACVSVEVISIEKLTKANLLAPDLDRYDMIGLAHPIYGFTTPSIVDSFVATFPPGNGRRVFILKTAADFISINHNASSALIQVLQERAYDVFYDRIIVMPSNWVITYDDSMTKQLCTTAEKKASHMSADLIDAKRRQYNPGIFIKLLSTGLAYMEKNHGSRAFGSSLRVDALCNQCELCVRNCPVNNINTTDRTVSFGDNCMGCMRCIYRCPKEAITSKGMNFCALKGGYDIEKALKNDNAGDEFVTADTRGYFKHFLRYFEDASL